MGPADVRVQAAVEVVEGFVKGWGRVGVDGNGDELDDLVREEGG